MRTEVLRFGVVGSIGFLVDAGVLMAVIELFNWSPLLGRAVSFPVALSATWYLNRIWTFEFGRTRRAGQQYLLYGAVQIFGAGINYAIFSVLILTAEAMRTFPVAPLAVGSLSAMTITFLLSRRFAFKPL